ncbi:MAG: AI-2E family transporter [Sphingomonadaceae bacterium]|nr:AI-2E family transporter [Sphingomonadaceae bacterium]
MADDNTGAGFARKCLIVLAFVALAATLYALGQLFLMIFGAIVVAVVLRAMARQFIRFGINDGFAVTLAVLALFAIIAGISWIFGGLVSAQFVSLAEQIPGAVDATQRQLDIWGIDYDIEQASRDIGSQLSGLTSQAGNFAMSAGGVVTNIILVLAGAIFFAVDPELYRNSLLRLVPKDREAIIALASKDSARALGLWLQAQILSSMAVIVLTYIGLSILGVPSAAALAIIAGALDFIPFIGPVVAGIPAVLVAFSVSPTTALWTVGLYLVIQQIQGNILQPLIQKRSVDLSPAVLLFAVVAAGTLFGIVGVILSAPLTVVAFVLVQRLYIEGVLGKPAKTPGPGADDIEAGEETA